jgi:hypothetical protein
VEIQSLGKTPREKKRMRDVKVIESSELTCYKCNGSGHVRRKCPTYLRSKGKAMNATLSDSDSSTS